MTIQTVGTDIEPEDGLGWGGQPRGLSVLFLTEMWERFSYYGIRPLLILFMTAALMDGGFGYDRQTASSIVGIYAASVYLAALPGGWVADRLLGLRRAIWYGGCLIASGHLLIALSLVLARSAFFLGLVFIVLGTGLLKPNISAIVGELYPGGGSRRDAGFSIFYMGINLGALLGPLVTGYLGEKVGWHYGFGAAGIGMIIGLITFKVRQGTLAGHGAEPTGSSEEKRKGWWVISGLLGTIALVTGLAMAGLLPIHPVAVAEHMTAVIVAMALLYFGYLFFLGGLSTADRKRVVVILVLFIFSAIFWAGFEQAPTSLNLFARDYTDRVILGWQMPTLWLQSVNSLFVILLAPVFAWGWIWFSRHGGDFSSPAKFSLGLLLAGLGFLLMVVPATMILRAGGVLKVSVWWLTASYLFQSAGELALSPVGLSSMTKLAPRAFAGQMMGVWFMATALGNLIAGLVGGKVNPEQLEQMPALFKQTAFSLLIAAVILALLIRPIRNMMREKPAS